MQQVEESDNDNDNNKGDIKEFKVPKITLEYVNQNIEVVREYFGLKESFTQVQMLTNQSIRSLEFIFPEIQEETLDKEKLEIATYG